MKFSETERTIELDLGDGLTAKGLVYRDKMIQEPPHIGDRVIAFAELQLPVDDSQFTGLHRALRFGRRAFLFGEDLNEEWGNLYSHKTEDGKSLNYRYFIKDFKAETWKEAFDEAEVYIRTQMGNLFAVLQARKKALIDADEIKEN